MNKLKKFFRKLLRYSWCKKCGRLVTAHGHFARGWNDELGQAAGDSGYICNNCCAITFVKTEEEYLKTLPHWCSYKGEKGLNYTDKKE